VRGAGAVAAAAISALAAATGGSADEVLRSLQPESQRQFPRRPDPATPRSGLPAAVRVIYPDAMDDDDWAMTETKGWIDVTVRWTGGEQAVTFYDPTRLAQTVQTAVAQPGYFAERALVVVPKPTKDAVESTVAIIAHNDFVDVR
jgi:hypothetical protein